MVPSMLYSLSILFVPGAAFPKRRIGPIGYKPIRYKVMLIAIPGPGYLRL
jgi:hypothetical protein